MNKYITLTTENWDAEVLNSDRPVLVDFWAAWCGPCRVMNPIINNLAEKYADIVTIAKADIDETEEIASQYNIKAIPTILIFQNGKEVERIPGLVTQEVLEQKLNVLTVDASVA